jgi:hypothetical protein
LEAAVVLYEGSLDLFVALIKGGDITGGGIGVAVGGGLGSGGFLDFSGISSLSLSDLLANAFGTSAESSDVV